MWKYRIPKVPNPVLQTDKGKDVLIKIGDYIYCESHDTFINDGGGGQTIPTTTTATLATDLKAAVAGTLEMSSPAQDQVYQGFKSKVNLWNPNMKA
jgi:hypothetical protein